MNDIQLIALAAYASPEATEQFLKDATTRLTNLGFEAISFFGSDTENCGIKAYKDGTLFAHAVGDKRRLSYSDICSIQRHIEQYCFNQRINELLPRMAALGWSVYTNDNHKVYIDTTPSGDDSTGYEPTYESLWAIEEQLTRAELRRMVLKHQVELRTKVSQTLNGAISLGNDRIIINLSNGYINLRYTDPDARSRLRDFLQANLSAIPAIETPVNDGATTGDI